MAAEVKTNTYPLEDDCLRSLACVCHRLYWHELRATNSSALKFNKIWNEFADNNCIPNTNKKLLDIYDRYNKKWWKQKQISCWGISILLYCDCWYFASMKMKSLWNGFSFIELIKLNIFLSRKSVNLKTVNSTCFLSRNKWK